MSVELSFALLAFETLCAAVYGIRRYGSPLNPLTFNTLFETGFTTLFAGLISYALLPLAPYSAGDMIRTVALSGLYLAAFTFPYCFRGKLPSAVFGRFMRVLGLNSDNYALAFRPAKFVGLLAASTAAFVALAAFGGGGFLWVTNTREAYLFFREGAGFLWLLSAWFLMTAFMYYLWGRRPTGWRLITALGLCAVAAYLTGSKQVILCVLITVVAYYHFLIRPVSTATMTVLGFLSVAGFFALLFFQSSMTAVNFLSYFENFDVTTRFLSRFSEYGYRWGAGSLSELWFYVPRALYPAKPLEYGALLIPAHLYPGAYEKGYAPGFLGWSLSYLDFGWVGVVAAGMLRGVSQRAIFEHYLEHRHSLFAFVFMMQFCIWWVLAFATFPIVVVWSVSVALLLRLVLVKHRVHPIGRTRVESGQVW